MDRPHKEVGIVFLDHFSFEPLALSALDQYLDGAVGELEQLQHARKRADLVAPTCASSRERAPRSCARPERSRAHSLVRKAVKKLISSEKKSVKASANNLAEYLGVPKYRYGEIEGEDLIGVVIGLAWNDVGRPK